MKSIFFLSLLPINSLIVVATPKSETELPHKRKFSEPYQLVQLSNSLDIRQATDPDKEGARILRAEFTHIIIVENLLESESYLKPPKFDYEEYLLVDANKGHIELLNEESQPHSYLKITNENLWDQITVSSEKDRLAAIVFKDRLISVGLICAKIEDFNINKSAMDSLEEWSFVMSTELPFMVFKDGTGRRSLFSFFNTEIETTRCQEIEEVRNILYIDIERGDLQIKSIPIKRD